MGTLINSSIVGIKFHDGAHDKLLATLPGSPVTLVREPSNKYDPNAVRVEIDGVMCGYVPKAQAARLAEDMDNGREVTAALFEYSKLTVEVADKPFHNDPIPDLTPVEETAKKHDYPGDDLIDEVEI
jgi:hypothetical protein